MTNFEKYHEEMIEKKYRAVKDGKPHKVEDMLTWEVEE